MPKVPSIRLVSSSGRQVWSRGLDCPECDALYLADGPLLIVTYGSAMYGRGEDKRTYDYKIRVLDIDGHSVARIDGRGKKELREVIIDSANRYLYFDVGYIACYDLVTHRLLSPIPEDPLVQLGKSHDPRDSSTARRFLEQHLSSGKHEYDR
jgi:hypothetical protein